MNGRMGKFVLLKPSTLVLSIVELLCSAKKLVTSQPSVLTLKSPEFSSLIAQYLDDDRSDSFDLDKLTEEFQNMEFFPHDAKLVLKEKLISQKDRECFPHLPLKTVPDTITLLESHTPRPSCVKFDFSCNDLRDLDLPDIISLISKFSSGKPELIDLSWNNFSANSIENIKQIMKDFEPLSLVLFGNPIVATPLSIKALVKENTCKSIIWVQFLDNPYWTGVCPHLNDQIKSSHEAYDLKKSR